MAIGGGSGKLTLPQAMRSDMSYEKPASFTPSEIEVEAKPANVSTSRRIGFMDGEFSVPDDFDQMYAEEIRAMFEDGPLLSEEPPEPA